MQVKYTPNYLVSNYTSIDIGNKQFLQEGINEVSEELFNSGFVQTLVKKGLLTAVEVKSEPVVETKKTPAKKAVKTPAKSKVSKGTKEDDNDS